MESFLPAGVAIASVTLTYVMCIRPVRRGGCAMTPAHPVASETDARDENEMRRLRTEIDTLRGSGSAEPPRPVGQPASETGQ